MCIRKDERRTINIFLIMQQFSGDFFEVILGDDFVWVSPLENNNFPSPNCQKLEVIFLLQTVNNWRLFSFSKLSKIGGNFPSPNCQKFEVIFLLQTVKNLRLFSFSKLSKIWGYFPSPNCQKFEVIFLL